MHYFYLCSWFSYHSAIWSLKALDFFLYFLNFLMAILSTHCIKVNMHWATSNQNITHDKFWPLFAWFIYLTHNLLSIYQNLAYHLSYLLKLLCVCLCECLSTYVCVRVYMCMFMCMYKCVCTYVWRPEVKVRCLSQCPLTFFYFFLMGLSLILTLTDLALMTGQHVSGIFLSWCPQSWCSRHGWIWRTLLHRYFGNHALVLRIAQQAYW